MRVYIFIRKSEEKQPDLIKNRSYAEVRKVMLRLACFCLKRFIFFYEFQSPVIVSGGLLVRSRQVTGLLPSSNLTIEIAPGAGQTK